MESNQYPKNRIATLRPSKWAAGAAAMLLSASLLAGCMGGGTGTTPSDATSTPVVDAAGTATPEVTDTDEMTDTEGMDDTDTTSDTEGMDDSDTMTDTEGMDDSDSMTDTEDMTGGEEITGTDTTTN